MTQYRIVAELDPQSVTHGTVERLQLEVVRNALGLPIAVPVFIARGSQSGPTLGVTAALHGDELNGIRVVQHLIAGLDCSQLSGTLIAVPVVNVPAYLRKQRRYTDGIDLNRVMPGSHDGEDSRAYAHHLFVKVTQHLDALVDLHTASKGRIGMHYINADMRKQTIADMARMQHAEAILHRKGGKGTFRRQAVKKGIPAITVELCDPSVWQHEVIERGLMGVRNVAVYFGMLPGEIEPAPTPAIELRDAYWIYTDSGGLLDVQVELGDRVRQGQPIARMLNVYGDVTREYTAPEDGVIMGKSTQPVNRTGGRIVRLGLE